MPERPQSSPVFKIAIVAVFAALALATNYALIGIPNVKLMDALVFLAAFLFGLKVGAAVGGSTWIVYGFINPQGSADLILLSFLITGECFYALAAAGLRKTTIIQDFLESGRLSGKFSLVFGTVGLLATLAYDVLTNIASWLFLTTSFYDAVVFGLITGAPFSLIHEVSNLILFATATPAAIIAAKRLSWTNLTETSIR